MGQSLEHARAAYEALRALGKKVNMGRGNPSDEQLDYYDRVARGDFDNVVDGVAVRNYSPPQHAFGLPSVRKLGGELLGLPNEQVFALGQSSLSVMYDMLHHAITHPLPGSTEAWVMHGGKPIRPRILSLEPGYDRYNRILSNIFEYVGIEMTRRGPNLKQVEAEFQNPATVAMWCNLRYQNPTGVTFSEDTCDALAHMQAANNSLRLLVDDAYCMHSHSATTAHVPNMHDLCVKAGYPHRAWIFASTAKMGHPGSGLSFVGSSSENMAWLRSWLANKGVDQADKVTQARFIKAFPNKEALKKHMDRHAAHLAPKFALLDRILHEHLKHIPGCIISKPDGGYFGFVALPEEIGKGTREHYEAAGLTTIPPGAMQVPSSTVMHGWNRLAITALSLEEIELGANIFGISARLAYEEHKAFQALPDA